MVKKPKSAPKKPVERRSITDKEIALIKGMKALEMKNSDIQFFFNNPERAVNSGRISDIASGKYSNSAQILAASSSEVKKFINEFSPVGVSATITISAIEQPDDVSPLSDHSIKKMFKKEGDGEYYLLKGEDDRHECKENFRFKYQDKWVKAVAALANNSGGYIFFGIRDKSVEAGVISADSYRVIGMNSDEFRNADPADFSKKIKSLLDPTPHVETKIVDFEGKSVGIMYVQQHSSRPVIALKQEGSISEDDIYYRYPGQSAKIKYSDLRTIMDDNARSSQERMLPLLLDLIRIGPDHAMVADLSSGVLRGETGSLTISEDLIDKINFIKEGSFDEKDGAPALRLVGDVLTSGSVTEEIRQKFVAVDSVVDDFLSQGAIFIAEDYIRCIVVAGNGRWLPIHYFVKLAGLSTEDAKKMVASYNAAKSRRDTYQNRLSRKESAFKHFAGSAGDMRSEMEDGHWPALTSVEVALIFCRAVNGIVDVEKMPLIETLPRLSQAKEILLNDGTDENMSVFRRAVAWVDELHFGPVKAT